jgi:hypothetical protein
VDEQFYDPRFDRVLGKLSMTIDKTEFRNAESDAREQFNLEWKQVSLVLDRILLLIFFLAIVISSTVILTSSPHLYGNSIDAWQISDDNLPKVNETATCGVH